MPYNQCDPCCDIAATARDNGTFKAGVLSLLCFLTSAAGVVEAAQNLITIAFGTFTNTFASAGLTGVVAGVKVRIDSGLDKDIYYNWDNTANPNGVVLAGGTRTIQAPTGATQLYVRYVTAPSAGNAYFSVGV